MSETITTVVYGSRPTPEFQHLVVSRFSFEETIERLKRVLDSENLWLVHEIDPQMLLQRGGYRIHATRQLLFFHPRYMARLLALDPNALIEAPLKLVIMQMPDGSVTLRYQDVTLLFTRYVALEVLATEFTEIYQRLVASVETLL